MLFICLSTQIDPRPPTNCSNWLLLTKVTPKALLAQRIPQEYHLHQKMRFHVFFSTESNYANLWYTITAVKKKKKTENAQVRYVNRFPRLLTSLFDRKYCSYDDNHLREECTKIFDRGVLCVTESEEMYLEEQTRLQAQSQLRFQHRVGRITASKFGDICKAKLIKPTASLVKSTMQDNELDSSKVPALQWGVSNECVSRGSYLQLQGIEHDNLEYWPAGLHIHK